MNPDDPHFCEVEEMLRELSRHDHAPMDEAMTERLQRAMDDEFRHHIRRRRYRMLAPCAAALLVSAALALELLPFGEPPLPAASLASSASRDALSHFRKKEPLPDIPQLKRELPAKLQQERRLSYDSRTGAEFSVGELGSYDIEAIPMTL